MKLLTATEWAGVAFMVALMMTMEAGFKLFNKVCKRQGKSSKKDQHGSAEDSLSCLDETGLSDSSSVVNRSDSNEDSHDDKNDSVDEINVDDGLGAFDAQNQLYMLEMILSFHAWYKCGSSYLLERYFREQKH